MVGVIVTFQFGDDFDRGKVEGVARESVPMFEGVPGLRSKTFTLDETSGRAVNFYLWESRQAATASSPPSSSSGRPPRTARTRPAWSSSTWQP